MKHTVLTLVLVAISMAVVVAAGCGGGDASFSPDPNVGALPGEPLPGDPGGGGGTTETQDSTVVTTDCFETGFCERKCIAASECPAGFSCVLNLCTFDCQSDDECGTGGACNDAGLCVVAGGDPLPLCTVDAECGDGRRCASEGACEKIPVAFGCQGDVDCPAGQYCDEGHQCQLYPAAGVGCTLDDDCLGNSYCGAASLCQQECRSDYQCADGEACDAHGRCVTPGVPAKLVSFSFNALGAKNDPAGPVVFTSASFTIEHAEIVPAGRSETLTSQHYRLIGSAGF